MTTQTNERPFEILLVEDDEADAMLVDEVLRAVSSPVSLRVAVDGEQALEYLCECVDNDRPTPHMILLDLNMPRMNGRELLAIVKARPEFAHIPIVVFTTSNAEADVMQTYRLHANAYVVKPIDIDEFQRVIGMIEGFYADTATLADRH